MKSLKSVLCTFLIIPLFFITSNASSYLYKDQHFIEVEFTPPEDLISNLEYCTCTATFTGEHNGVPYEVTVTLIDSNWFICGHLKQAEFIHNLLN